MHLREKKRKNQDIKRNIAILLIIHAQIFSKVTELTTANISSGFVNCNLRTVLFYHE